MHGFFGSGIAFIILFLAFGEWGLAGIASVILFGLIIWVGTAYAESMLQSPIELTDSMVAKGKVYLLFVRFVLAAVIIFVIYKVLSVSQ